MRAADDGALEDGGNESDEAEETACVFCGVSEEVVGHEGEGKFHAGEEEDKSKVRHVEQEVRVRPLASFLLPIFHVSICDGRLGLRSSRQRLRKTCPQVYRLAHDQEKRHSCCRRKRIRLHALHGAQPSPQRRPKRKRNREASPHQRHRRPALALITDIRRNRHRQLHISLTQPPHDPTRQECAEIRSSHPERDAQHVTRHGP